MVVVGTPKLEYEEGKEEARADEENDSKLTHSSMRGNRNKRDDALTFTRIPSLSFSFPITSRSGLSLSTMPLCTCLFPKAFVGWLGFVIVDFLLLLVFIVAGGRGVVVAVIVIIVLLIAELPPSPTALTPIPVGEVNSPAAPLIKDEAKEGAA